MNEEINHIKIQVTRLINKDNESIILEILDLLNKKIDNKEL